MKHIRSAGFSVVEITVVITVIAVLVVIAITASANSRTRGTDDDRQSDVSAIARDIEGYFLDQSSQTQPSYPSTSYFNSGTDAQKKQKLEQVFGTADGDKLRAPDVTQNSFTIATSNQPQSPTVGQYIYQPLRRNGRLCTHNLTTSTPSGRLCVRYVLFYRTAGDNQVKRHESIHQQ